MDEQQSQNTPEQQPQSPPEQQAQPEQTPEQKPKKSSGAKIWGIIVLIVIIGLVIWYVVK